MAFYDQQRSWYFHDLWKRTPSTWGGGPGYTWQRVDVESGPKLDYAEFAEAVTAGNIIRLSSYGQSGIARRWRWNGAAWALEETRSTGDTGALDPPTQGNASPFAENKPGILSAQADVTILVAALLAAWLATEATGIKGW